VSSRLRTLVEAVGEKPNSGWADSRKGKELNPALKAVHVWPRDMPRVNAPSDKPLAKAYYIGERSGRQMSGPIKRSCAQRLGSPRCRGQAWSSTARSCGRASCS
jgi:hypothetical protein